MFIHNIPLHAIVSDFSTFVKMGIKEITKLHGKWEIIDLKANPFVNLLCELIRPQELHRTSMPSQIFLKNTKSRTPQPPKPVEQILTSDMKV